MGDKCTWQENCRFSHGNNRSVSSFESATSGLQLSPDSSFQAKELMTNNIKEEVQPANKNNTRMTTQPPCLTR